MKILILTSLIVSTFISTHDFLNKPDSVNKLQKDNISEKGLCTLTGAESTDPFPSLSKCFQYNNNACCTSVHDDIISQLTSNLLTDPCLRKYSELEQLMCLGCHPYEYNYINTDTNTLNICLSFALLLWDASYEEELEHPTTKYDNCGFKVPDHLKDLTKYQHYIIPSESFGNITKFIEAIQIPFYENYKINLVNDVIDKNAICFAKGSYVKYIWGGYLFLMGMLVLG